MEYEVYCDESCLEAITRKDAHIFTGIGSIWIQKERRDDLKSALKEIKARHNIRGELKWQKLSPAYYDVYREVIDFYFNADYIRFRVILVESQKVDNVKFNNDDAELGFYKFYYQLLKNWIYDFNGYWIFTDLKQNRDRKRLNELERVLDYSNLTSNVKKVQGLPSDQSLGIQLADILTGLTVSKFNNEISASAKKKLIEYVEEKYLLKEIAPTAKWEEKFNIFKINLQGGW
jgi:hypothetical protein